LYSVIGDRLHFEPGFPMKMNLAERELSAFFAAVETLFGLEQAKLSAEEWLDAAEQVFGPNEPNSRDCRGLTIIAASRLAHRLAAARDRANV
jgi:hypothetical protein